MKKKEILKKTLLYFLCMAYAEFMLAMIFLMCSIGTDFDWSIWKIFGWVQIVVPFVALLLFAFFLAGNDKDEEAAKKSEWIGRVNKMLEEYEKEKEK